MGNASVPNTETGAAVLTSAITRAVTQETPAAIAVPQAAAASAVENVMPKSVQLTVDGITYTIVQAKRIDTSPNYQIFEATDSEGKPVDVTIVLKSNEILPANKAQSFFGEDSPRLTFPQIIAHNEVKDRTIYVSRPLPSPADRIDLFSDLATKIGQDKTKFAPTIKAIIDHHLEIATAVAHQGGTIKTFKYALSDIENPQGVIITLDVQPGEKQATDEVTKALIEQNQKACLGQFFSCYNIDDLEKVLPAKQTGLLRALQNASIPATRRNIMRGFLQSTTGPQAAPPAISTPESAPERKIDFLGIELTLGEGIPPAMFPVDISVWDAESPADMENIQAHLKALSEYNYSLNEITIAQGQPGNSIAGFDNNNDRLVFTTISREMARCEDGQDQNYFASMRGRFLYHLEKLLAHKLNKLQTEKRRKEAIHSAFPDVDLESLTPSDNVFIGPGDQPMPAVGIIKIPAQKTLELPTRVSIVYGEMGRSGDSRTPVIIAHIPQNLGITPYHTKYEPTAVSNEAGAAYRTLYMNLSDSSIFPVYADASLPGVQMLRDGSGNSSVCTISRLLDLTGTVADVEQLEKLNLDDTNKDNIQQTIKVHYELCAQEFAKAGVEITHFSYAYFPESRRGYLLSLWGRKNEDGEERLKETNLKFVRGKLAERFANAISSEAVDSNPLPEATVSPSSDGDHSVPEIAPLAEHVTAAPVEPTTPVVPTAPATPSSAPPKKPKRTGLRATIAAAAIAAAAGGIGYALWRNTAPPTRHQPTAAPITDTASPETSKPAAPPTATPETQPPPKPLSEITEDEKKKILDSF